MPPQYTYESSIFQLIQVSFERGEREQRSEGVQRGGDPLHHRRGRYGLGLLEDEGDRPQGRQARQHPPRRPRARPPDRLQRGHLPQPG